MTRKLIVIRNSNCLIDQRKNYCNCLCNCSVVKVNDDNISSNDCTAGQASGGSSSANGSRAMINNSEINNSTNRLQTAKANISPADSTDLSQSIEARTLFDSCSQKSFVTERLRNKLNLKTL